MITEAISTLDELRDYGGERVTDGLAPEILESFYQRDPVLRHTIEKALAAHRTLRENFSELLKLPEAELCSQLQADYVNFYVDEAINPYVAIAATGPWIVTTHGAVLHDSGGYGMLGLGHAPEAVAEALSKTWVMANVMSPHFSQHRLASRLKRDSTGERIVQQWSRIRPCRCTRRISPPSAITTRWS
jgi:hypothetical protein